MLREREAYRGSWGQFKLFFSVERKKSFISICNNAMRERNDRERRRNKKQCEQGSKKEKEGCNIWDGKRPPESEADPITRACTLFMIQRFALSEISNEVA